MSRAGGRRLGGMLTQDGWQLVAAAAPKLIEALQPPPRVRNPSTQIARRTQAALNVSISVCGVLHHAIGYQAGLPGDGSNTGGDALASDANGRYSYDLLISGWLKDQDLRGEALPTETDGALAPA